MKTPDLDRLLVRACRVLGIDAADVERLCEAIAEQQDAQLLHEAAADLDRLGDRVDRSVSRARAG